MVGARAAIASTTQKSTVSALSLMVLAMSLNYLLSRIPLRNPSSEPSPYSSCPVEAPAMETRLTLTRTPLAISKVTALS